MHSGGTRRVGPPDAVKIWFGFVYTFWGPGVVWCCAGLVWVCGGFGCVLVWCDFGAGLFDDSKALGALQTCKIDESRALGGSAHQPFDKFSKILINLRNS